MKFSEINLVGFAQFALKIEELFENDLLEVTNGLHTDMPSITLKKRNSGSFDSSFEIAFHNPTGSGEYYESSSETILEMYSNSIKTEFYYNVFDEVFYINIPLRFFDEIEFIEILKSWVGKKALVPHDEEDDDVIYEYAKKWFFKELETSGLIKYVTASDFEKQFRK
jgi:hypothetical protein